MSPQRWEKIEEIFQAALDLSVAERERFVSESCAGDAELKKEVEKLIKQYEDADSFIESPVWTDSAMLNSIAKKDFAGAIEDNLDGDPLVGRRLGAFRLTKELGRGGMGAVYLAERADGEFRQSVAVKLIKRGMDTDFIIRRFRHERQILASLDHPHIARLLDGGTTDDGLPFFVMEYIEGEPLYQYCDSKKLNLRQRLALFQQICGAVAYAHKKQIIHRDIKPGNILITAGGIPKLLDFGIAKILDPDLIHESINPTSTMMRLMTPEYASPEQVRGGDVTPASDVYALGVLLFELLTGHRPYSFTGRSPHEVSRVICEVEPELPSVAVAKNGGLLPHYVQNGITAERVFEIRQTNLTALQHELTGDLDNIILNALCKDFACRYGSVQEFSGDILRHLEGTAVNAPTYIRKDDITEKPASIDPITGSRSLAVLPFKLLTQISEEDTGDKFLGLGLADALITRLSNIRRFVVRPTSSVLRYGEGQAADPLAAGRELGVEFILDGHIQKAGDRIRVSVQLLSVAERSTIWAERFDEKFTDVLSLEDAISTQVAIALIPKLTGVEREQLMKRGTHNAAAFEAYLRGRYHWNSFTEEGFAKAIVAYNQATALDPEYALAYAGIADYYNWLGVYGVLPPRECFMAAIDAAETAIKLDESLSEAHAALGFAILAGEFDWTRAENACRRALELNPHNAIAHIWYSLQLFMEGRFEDGERHANRSIQLDPLTAFNSYNLGWCLYFARRHDEAQAQLEKTIAGHPLYAIAHLGLSWVLRLNGKHDEAINAIKRGRELSTDSILMLTSYGQAQAAAGNREAATDILRHLDELAARRYVSPYHVGIIYNFLGNKEQTLTALEQSFEEKEAWMLWLGVEPSFDNLRDEPRFLNLLEKTGNPLFFRASTVVLDGRPTVQTEAETRRQALPFSRRTTYLRYGAVAASFILAAAAIYFAFGKNLAAMFGGKVSVKAELNQEPPKNLTAAPVPEQPRIRAIAVLPFTTLDAKSDDEQYLGVGTADLVTNKLSEIKEVNLRSSSSVRRYLNTQKSAADVGKELAVDYVVSGTIQRAGSKVLAKLQMISIGDSSVVWSEDFEEPNSSLFELQDSISEKITKALSLRLTKNEQQNLTKHFTENSEAYQLYLAGRYHFGKRTIEGLQQAINLFEQASTLDPKFALAHAGLADCHALLNWYQEPAPPDAWQKAQTAAAKAVKLDANLAEARASLAFILFHYERNFPRAEEEFRRAIELKPNYATAHQWYAFFLSARGRHDEAIREMRRAEELEPRSAVIATAVANVMFHAELYDEAIAQTQRALEIDPGSVAAHVILRWTYEKKGMADEALAIYEKERAFAGDTPTTRAKFAHVLASSGKIDEARRILQDLIDKGQANHVTPYEIAVIYSLLNDKSEALTWLNKARDTHAPGFSFVSVDPHLSNLRNEPQFQEIIK